MIIMLLFVVNCEGVNNCSGFGVCTGQDLCSCYTGYFGANCSLGNNDSYS